MPLPETATLICRHCMPLGQYCTLGASAAVRVKPWLLSEAQLNTVA